MSKNNRQGAANIIAFIGLSATVTTVIHSLVTGKESLPPRLGWIAKRLETLRNNPPVADYNQNRRRDCGIMRLLGSEPSDDPAAHRPSNPPEPLNGAATHACR